jgi:single-strand DNA-binding protein
MMFNQVNFSGKVQRQPQLRAMPSGERVCEFCIWYRRHWKNKAGEFQHDDTYLDCAAFGEVGNKIHTFFNEKDWICVTGRLRQERWTDKKDGNPRTKLVCIVEGWRFVGDKRDHEGQPRGDRKPQSQDDGRDEIEI